MEPGGRVWFLGFSLLLKVGFRDCLFVGMGFQIFRVFRYDS